MEHIESIKEDEEAESSRRVKRNRRRIIRDCEGAHERLYNAYFKVNEVVNERYLDEQFRRRFRMKRSLFCKIVDDIANMTVAGSNNDINILHQSPLFNDILTDIAPQCPFTVNGVSYTKGYYLADEIYPEWATFVKSFSYPQDVKRKKFKTAQESARKDVERAFGVLQSRWAIVRMPARAWVLSKIKGVMLACIILHNMIVEDGGYSIANIEEEDDTPSDPETSTQQRTFAELCELRIRKTKEIRDKETHNNLRSDLVELIWRLPTPFE